MPLHIDIRLNRELLHTLHIARLEGGTAPDDINTYVIVKGEEPLFREQWVANGTQYEHRYGDGADICVMKGIEAMNEEQE
jgi:hypothetical protein